MSIKITPAIPAAGRQFIDCQSIDFARAHQEAEPCLASLSRAGSTW
jgi:hypothetical protein